MTAATVAALVDRIRPKIEGSRRTRINKLSGPMNSGASTFTYLHSDNHSVNPGDYVEIDSEIMYVWSVTGTTATIERAQRGTVAASHADGSIIRVGSRFFNHDIIRSIEDEILSWPDRLFAIATDTITIGSDSTQAVGWSPTRFKEVLAARAVISGRSTLPEVDVSVYEDTDQFDGFTHAVKVINPRREATTIELVYAQGFDVSALSSLATTIDAIGLADTMIDIVEHGALARLLTEAIAERSDVASARDPGPDEQATATEVLRQVALASQIRDRRIAEEITRLREKYLPRF